MLYRRIPEFSKYAISRDGNIIVANSGKSVDYRGTKFDERCNGIVPYVELDGLSVPVPILLAYAQFGVLPFNIATPTDVMDMSKVCYDIDFSRIVFDHDEPDKVSFYAIPNYPNLAITRNGVVMRRNYANRWPIASRVFSSNTPAVSTAESQSRFTYVARLVYTTFIGDINQRHDIIQRDGDSTNLIPENLVQVTRSQRVQIFNMGGYDKWIMRTTATLTR